MDRTLCVMLCLMAIVAGLGVLAYCAEITYHHEAEPTIEPTVETTVVETTATEVTEPIETEPPIVLYDVPLDAELQLHIIEEADEHGIDPAIIMAMAYKESTYRPSAIGDGGKSFGLLQIRKHCHLKRMDRLGVTDLLDPYQNVVVAVDYLAEQIDRYGGDIAKGLTAYNRGHYAGTVTQYAKKILAHAEKINNERSQ